MSQSEFAAYVAIDWADRKHYWQLTDSGHQHREHGALLNTPESVDIWATGLLARFPSGSIAVCLEQSRGPLAYQLGKYERLVLFPVHPATMASFRQAFFPSGSKGDPSDAGLLLELLLHHRQRLRRLDPDSVETRLLHMLIELRRKLVDERTRQSNRLTAWLKMYFPQALDWIDNIDSPLGCDFLERWPTLQQLQRAHAETIERFFREHNSRSQARIDERVKAIRQAVPAVQDTALLQAGAAASTSLVALLKALNGALTSVDQQIAAFHKGKTRVPSLVLGLSRSTGFGGRSRRARPPGGRCSTGSASRASYTSRATRRQEGRLSGRSAPSAARRHTAVAVWAHG